MQTQCLRALPAVRPLGRHTCTDGALNLFYTASGFVCRFTGSELRLCLNAGFTLYEPWLSVEVNGAWVARFPVAAGESEVCLLRGMTPGVPKTVRVVKDVQAMPGDPGHFLQVRALRYDGGGFLPLPEPAYRLEFIGDSITSGEGTVGAVGEQDWVSMFFGALPHYARLTADALNADWRIVSQSGWGLLSSWDNDPHCRVLDHYDTVCGVAAGAPNAALGAQQPYDFAAWPADAVILNLGTNDEHALDNPPWTDPATGDAFAQRPTPLHLAALEQAAVDALKTVRARNPRALLVWAYGMLGQGRMGPLLRSAVARYAAETGDARAAYLPLPAATAETLGSRQHPGPACHRQAAETLTAFLQARLPR